MARVIDAIELHWEKKLSCVEAAELLGMSERHVMCYESRTSSRALDSLARPSSAR